MMDGLEIDEVVIEGKEINTINYIECVNNKIRRPQRQCIRIKLPTIKGSFLNTKGMHQDYVTDYQRFKFNLKTEHSNFSADIDK